MGLDSVELILAWEESFSISISDAEAGAKFTTRQVAQRIFEKVRSGDPEDHGCLSLRAFLRLRDAFGSDGVPRERVHPEARVSELLPHRNRRDVFTEISVRAGLSPPRRLPFGLQFTFGRIRDVITDAVIQQHQNLRRPCHGWSLRQVREVVRAVMFTQLSLRGFSDDAEIVRDLGVE